jgi:Mor family transcriptional regulator
MIRSELSSEEDQFSVFEAILNFLDNTGDANLHSQVIESLSELFIKSNAVASKTSLPRKITEIARRVYLIV